MKVSAFTIVKNAILLEYPLVESILSLLPIVDEYVVLVGKSDDATLDLVRGIGSAKIRVVVNEWHDDNRRHGFVFSDLTNVALAECTGDWAFYLQADEVIHEKDLPTLTGAMQAEFTQPGTQAIALRIRNFHGDYWTWNPYSHRKLVRIIRNNGKLESAGDAVSFRFRDHSDRRLIQYAMPRSVRWLRDVHIFHYSWVKDRRNLLAKRNLMEQHYYGDDAQVVTNFQLDCYYKLFRGSHPQVMKKRIVAFQSSFPPYPNRWLNSKFYLHLLRHGYKG